MTALGDSRPRGSELDCHKLPVNHRSEPSLIHSHIHSPAKSCPRWALLVCGCGSQILEFHVTVLSM